MTVAILVTLSLVTLVAETMVAPDSTTMTWLLGIETVVWVVFIVEYTLRVWTSPEPLRYVRSFYGIIDLLAVMSGFAHITMLGTLKTLRVFRVVRVFKLVRYTRVIQKFSDAFDDVKDELVIYLTATAILTFLASYGIYEFEHENNSLYGNIFECTYWAVASLTAGAEGVAPVTVPGKVLTMVLMLIGVSVVAVPSGLLASALSRQEKPATRTTLTSSH